MRTATVYNYSFTPPKVLGTVTLTDAGKIEFSGFKPLFEKELNAGIGHDRVTPDHGRAFFDALPLAYSGSYVRAVEDTHTQPKG